MKLKAKMPVSKIENVSTQIYNITFLTNTNNIDCTVQYAPMLP